MGNMIPSKLENRTWGPEQNGARWNAEKKQISIQKLNNLTFILKHLLEYTVHDIEQKS